MTEANFRTFSAI